MVYGGDPTDLGQSPKLGHRKKVFLSFKNQLENGKFI